MESPEGAGDVERWPVWLEVQWDEEGMEKERRAKKVQKETRIMPGLAGWAEASGFSCVHKASYW